MTDLNYIGEKGYRPENLTSIQQQMYKLYGTYDSGSRPSKFALYARDLLTGSKSEDSIERLPPKYAPVGNQNPSAGFIPANQPWLSNETYHSTARTGLSVPMSRPQPAGYGARLTLEQQKQQQEATSKYLARNQYSRSVAQRISTYDRGLN